MLLLLSILGCRKDPVVDSAPDSVVVDSVDSADSADSVDSVPLDSEPADADQDGYGVDEDCDDTNSSVNPGATEICNDVDDDCNGEVDDSVGDLWYDDVDGDLYGSADSERQGCDAEGGVANGDDCDDSDPGVHPGATELCNSGDDDCDDQVDEDAADADDWYIDYDGDGEGSDTYVEASCEQPSGYVDNDDDCDDTDSAVNTAAAETCDTVDNDCDGRVDPDDSVDAPEWYIDYDGDGEGSSAFRYTSCSAPTGYVGNPDDCDDTDADIHTSASEVCDGVDNDCDGDVDDDDSDGPSSTTYYADADGDGYGDASTTEDACEAPSGYVDNDEDCDDTDSAISPDAAEVCDEDEVDEDCDGDVNDDDSDISGTTWYLDDDGDGYGDSAGGTTSACAEPSGYASTDDDCDDADSGVNPGATETCNNADDDCDGDIDSATACSDCDFEEDSGSRYLLCTATSATWSDAESSCQGWGYELNTIDDATENAVVAAYNSTYSMGDPWIGLSDVASEGTWVWSSGSSSTYTNWGSGEPNDSGGEDCTHIYTSGSWNDLPCSSSRAYVCESE